MLSKLSRRGTTRNLRRLKYPTARIKQVAAADGLGAFHCVRIGGNPVLGAAFVLVGCSLPLVLDIVLIKITGAQSSKLAGAGLGLLLFGLVAAVGVLVRGFTHVYLFDNGLVRSKNGRVRVLTWAQVREVKRWRAGGKTAIAGTLLAYYVMAMDGRKVSVEAKMKNGRDNFGEQLERLAQNASVPVVEGGPAVGELRAR